MRDYKYIRAWGQMLQSFPAYIEHEVDTAREDNAPETAICRNQDGTWETFEDITRDDVCECIRAIVSKL